MPESAEDSARQLADRIYHAIHLVPNDGSGLDAHAVWDCQQLMRNLSLRHDMTAQEVMAFAVILAGANDRKLRGTTSGDGVPVLGVDLEGKRLRAV